MKNKAFRTKTPEMIFLVVHDHPRSRYMYILNVYHGLIERWQKRFCRKSEGIIQFTPITKDDLTRRDKDTLHRLATDHNEQVRISKHIFDRSIHPMLMEKTAKIINDWQ